METTRRGLASQGFIGTIFLQQGETTMKTLAFLLVLFAPQGLLAGPGTCVSHADKGAHEGFCNNLNQQTCGVHSSLCTWEKAKVKTLQIIGQNSTETLKVIEKTEHGCAPKAGMEAHASFCANQNKVTCAVHSMCQWE